VIRWATGQQIRRVGNSARFTRPALNWPLLAFVRQDSGRDVLLVRDFRTGKNRKHFSVKRRDDIGRPSLRDGRLAWHTVARGQSKIHVRSLASGQRRVIDRSKISMLTNPSLFQKKVVWAELRPRSSILRIGWLDSSKRRTVEKIGGKRTRYWTTALIGRTAYSTRWNTDSGTAVIYRKGF
jgi:hypothetical protein